MKTTGEISDADTNVVVEPSSEHGLVTTGYSFSHGGSDHTDQQVIVSWSLELEN